MSDGTRERREFQRVMLETPLVGRLGSTEIRLVEIGVPGARVKHRTPLPLATSEILSLTWAKRPIEIESEVVRTSLLDRPDDDGDRYQSGIRFVRALDDSDRLVRQLVFDSVSTLLRRFGGTPIRTYRDIDADRTIRTRDAGFISLRLENGRWRKKRIFLPEQPEVGFTVARGFDEDEIQKVCDAYEKADAEERRLLRLFAELSIAEVMGVPPREA